MADRIERAVEIPIIPVFEPFLQPSRYKGAYGGRGSAKSHSFADLLVDRCLVNSGTRAVCVREFQQSLEQSVKRLLEDKIATYDLGNHFRVMNTHIETPGDGIIIFQGMSTQTRESVKSLEGYDIAWVEEAQSLSQSSLDLLRPTIREPGSEIWLSWNPKFPTDPVDKLLRTEPRLPNAIVIRSSFRDNPFFPAELLAEMKWDRARDPEKYAHVWLGEYERHSEARVFKNWKVQEFETPIDAHFLLGGDWGFSIDPSVLMRMFIQGRRLFIDHEVYKIGCEIDHTPALFDSLACKRQHTHGLYAADDESVPESSRCEGMARRWVILTDSARPETISYMQRHGYPRVAGAKKGKDSVKEGVEFLKSYDIIIHPRCKHTIDEFTLYSYKTHPLTGDIIPILEDKKNHVIDSARYAIEKVRTGFDYKEAGMTSSVTW